MMEHTRSASEQELFAALHNGTWGQRCDAARNWNATEQVLLMALQDPHPWVRRAAASNLQL